MLALRLRIEPFQNEIDEKPSICARFVNKFGRQTSTSAVVMKGARLRRHR